MLTDKALLDKAEAMCEYSYAPYSKFHVGAAILSSDGRVFTGCNVENSSYPGGICAERTAAVEAVSEGAREFIAIAVASSGHCMTYPCGICLQFLNEFVSDECRVILRNENGEPISFMFTELFPHGFRL